MIFCNLRGGLGNMLFQIAATKSFSIKKNVECSFPNLINHLEYLNQDSEFNYNLKHSLEYLTFLNKLETNKLNNQYKVINYPFDFIEILPNDGDLVNGFFQSEKYFKDNRKEVLDFINLKNCIDLSKSKYKNLFDNKCTSVHVRRGDYLKYPNHHPVQSIEYYLEGMNLLKDKSDVFLIFSDDIEWCKENFKNFDNTIYIEGEKDYIELYLMSLCDNNIISNSSFSWWGAWLNENENKTVIGPKKWFGSEITHNTGDVLPEKWIKI